MTFKDFVKKLQVELKSKGENLAVDGDFGPITERALAKYEVKSMSLELEPVRENPSGHDLKPAVSIIKEFEGLFLKAYLDPVQIPTIGWGTIKYPDGTKVRIGDQITAAQAEEYLLWEMQGFVRSVERLVSRPISNNAFCALVSFCYNLGAGALEKSTLLRKLNGGDSFVSVGDEFLKFINAGGRPLKGLIRRREAERKLFLA